MKGTIRRIVSILLATALVITSLNYTPYAVGAATEGYTEVLGESVGFEYKTTVSTLTGATAPILDGGETFIAFQYSGEHKSENTVVKVNGNQTESGTSLVWSVENGKTLLNMSGLSDTEFTTVEIIDTTSNKEIEVSLRKVSIPNGLEMFEAESYVSSLSSEGLASNSGDNSSGGKNLGGCYNGKYAGYTLYFEKPADKLSVNYVAPAKAGAGGSVEVYIDGLEASNKVGTVVLPQTDTDEKGWENGTYKTVTGALDKSIAAGKHNVYIKFVSNGYVANFDYFKFEKQVEELAAPTDFVLYNFRQVGEGYKPVFKDSNEIVITSGESYEYKIYAVNGADVEIGTVTNSGENIGTEAIDNLNFPNESRQVVKIKAVYTKKDGSVIESKATEIHIFYTKEGVTEYNYGVPKIFIQTADSTVNLLTDASKTKTNSTIVIKDKDGNLLKADYGTANVRGNSTATADKKAYNIKLNSKYDLFGMGEAKKWCLLANAYDKSLLRNKLALDLGAALGVPFTPESKYVDVYVNGTYNGSYMATEAIETGSTRVNIDSENTETYNTDALMELENNGKSEDGCTYITTSTYNQRFVFDSPEKDSDITPEFFSKKVEDITALFNKFETDLQTNEYSKISQDIDVDSFVNFYIVSEIFKNQDIAYSSTRFFVQNGKIYAGPLWDFDLSSGNVMVSYYQETSRSPEGYQATSMKWFEKLMANATFKSLVKKRFNEKLNEIKKLYTGEGNLIDTYTQECAQSFAGNYNTKDARGAGWKVGERDKGDNYSYANTHNFADYNESVTYLRTWLTERIEFLEKEWAEQNTQITELTADSKSNLALKKKVTVYPGCAEGSIDYLNDGQYTTGVNYAALTSEWNYSGESYAVIDLGACYDASTIDQIVVQYKNADADDSVYSKKYEIQYSTDNSEFRNVVPQKTVTYFQTADNDTIDYLTMDDVSSVEGAVRYVKVYYPVTAQYGMQLYEIAVLDTNGNAATIEATTTIPSITVIDPIEAPEGATWTDMGETANAKYQCYISTNENKIADKFVNAENNLQFSVKEFAAPFKSVKINGVEVDKTNGGILYIPESKLGAAGVYKVDIVDYYGNDTITLYVKKEKIANYAAQGVVGTINEGTATINWTASADAIADVCTYNVRVDSLGNQEGVSSGPVTFDASSLEYGNYNITVETVKDGAVVATTKAVLTYRDPSYVVSTVKFNTNWWEKRRYEPVSWTAVTDATGYAIYADGKLFDTYAADTLSAYIPAYAFAGNINSFNKPTTVGTHTTAVVALFENETAPENYGDVNVKHVMGSNTFSLYVNYVYGNQTTIWNNGNDSAWNFTICESNDAADITEGAVIDVNYNTDGSAQITYTSHGQHSTYTDEYKEQYLAAQTAEDKIQLLTNWYTGNPRVDQAWTVKTAIYDREIKTGDLLNLSFDIVGPLALVDQVIQIKCVPEEVNDDGKYNAVGDRYEEAFYTFVEEDYDGDGTKKAVLHYSNSFTAVDSTYDLLFGLGLLEFGNTPDEEKKVLFTDPTIVRTYGITGVTGTVIYDTENSDSNDIYVSWTTDVPNTLISGYTYNVIITDKETGEVVETYNNQVSDTKFDSTKGYKSGKTYTVTVESIYNNAITSTKSTDVTVKQITEITKKPDLIVSDISVTEGQFYVGDTVTVDVTIKNIGSDKVTVNTDNLLTNLYVNDKFVNSSAVTNKTLEIGESYVASFSYTIGEKDDGIYAIKGWADAGNLITNEAREDNNTYEKKFVFYPALTEATLTNTDNNVTVTWPKHDVAESYDITYISGGEVKQVTSSTESVVIEDPIDYNTEVIVFANDIDGDYHMLSKGTALPDLVIAEVSIPKTTYGVGQVIPITLTMRNDGVATAVPNQGNLTVKYRVDDVVSGDYKTMETDSRGQKLPVGETFTHTFNYTVTEADLEKGTIHIDGWADADSQVTETNEDNNYGVPVEIKIVEVERPDFIITNISIPKDSYAIGDVIPVTVTMKNDSGVDAELAEGNLTFKVRVNGENYGQNWYIVPKEKSEAGEELKNTIVKAGEEITSVVNYTVSEKDIVDGFIHLSAKADAEGALDGTGSILESDETNNIKQAAPIKVVEHGTLQLAYNEGASNDSTTAFVSATWTVKADTAVTGYKLTYVDSSGATHNVIITDENATVVTSDDGTKTYTYNFANGTKLKYQSDAVISAVYDREITSESKYYEYATDKALPDLIITKVVSKESQPKINIGFTATATVKNIGTAEIPVGIDDMDHYGTWLGVTVREQTNVPQVIGNHTTAGLAIGESVELDINNIVIKNVGDYELVVKADDLGYDQQTDSGHFTELHEDNNTAKLNVKAGIDQSPMDWTPLQINMTTETDPYIFSVAATNSIIEYKVLDTTIKDIGYKDIFNKYVGYNGTWISMGVSSGKYDMLPVKDGTSTSTIHFLHVHQDYCENYDDELGQRVVAEKDTLLSVRNAEIVDGEGKTIKETEANSSPLVYNGNGFEYNTQSWGLGNYYVMVINNDKGDNITVGFRVSTNAGKWIRCSSTQAETDPDKLPFYYHAGHRINEPEVDADMNQVTGTFYYDATDYGLSSITCYNQGYLTVILDPSCALPVKKDTVIYELENGMAAWKVEIAYANVGTDANGEITVEDPGANAKWITWNGGPAGSIVANDGTNSILMKLPNIMQEIPIHSEKGGQRDEEYYFMRIYYDQMDHPEKYVPVPIKIAADIPEIEKPQNLEVIAGGKKMTVSFGETTLQKMREYYYTINIYKGVGENKENTPVVSSITTTTPALHHPTGTSSITEGGSYTYDVDGLKNVGNGYTVEVIAEWCEQSVTEVFEYIVKKPDTGNVEVMGFQMNSNTAEGAVSEFAPSFRIVSRAAKHIVNAQNEICGVVSFGTVYAFGDFDKSQMTVASAEAAEDDAIFHITATDEGIYNGYVSGVYDDSQQNYFAMTIKPVSYYYENLTDQYTVRAYAILDDGSYVYSDNCYTVTKVEIAEYLYKNQMMPSKAAHDYLYNNILNIVALNKNSAGIANAMLKTLGITSSDPGYAQVKTAYNEILWYTRCINQYKYSEHNGTIEFKYLPDGGKELLAMLNEKSGTNYETLYEWIEKQVPNVKRNNGTPYSSCYTKADYGWENDFYDRFDKE